MFATGSLARRIEEAEATLIADGAAGAAQRLSSEDVIAMPLGVGGRLAHALAAAGSRINK